MYIVLSMDAHLHLTFCSLAMIFVFSFFPTKSFNNFPLCISFPAHHSWAVDSSSTCSEACNKRKKSVYLYAVPYGVFMCQKSHVATKLMRSIAKLMKSVAKWIRLVAKLMSPVAQKIMGSVFKKTGGRLQQRFSNTAFRKSLVAKQRRSVAEQRRLVAEQRRSVSTIMRLVAPKILWGR